MPDIKNNLPRGLKGTIDLPKQREILLNVFYNGEGIVRRPGVAQFKDSDNVDVSGEGITRGSERWVNPSTLLEEWYMVSGNSLIKIDASGLKTVFPVNIPSNNRVIFSKTVDFLVFIVVGAGSAFYFDGTTVTPSTNVPTGGYRDVIVDTNRFLYFTSDGSTIEVSLDTTGGGNAPDSVAGNAFNAEDLPDKNTGGFSDNGDIYIGGTESFQLFRFNPIPGVDIPFTKVTTGTDPTGYISGKTKYKGTFAFLGRLAGESPAFYVKSQGGSEDISNSAIGEILRTYSSIELNECVGSRIKWLELEMLIFTLARHTLGFVEGGWFIIQSGITGQDNLRNWRAAYPIFVYDRYHVGDTENSRLGTIDRVFKEYELTDSVNNLIEWRIRGFMIFTPSTFFRGDFVELDCLTGTGEIDTSIQTEEIEGTIGLVLSSDGSVFNRDNEMLRKLGKGGKRDTRIRFSTMGGMGVYEKFLGYELRGTVSVNFSLEALNFGNDQN